MSRYCFTVSNPSLGIPFVAVLSYVDPPPTLLSSIVNVNSANLVVKDSNGNYYLGNGVKSRVSSTKTAEAEVSDDLNNSERVRVSSYRGGNFEVLVYGVSVTYPKSSMTASLVVTGEGVVSTTCADKVTQCPNNCSGRGLCKNGFCACEKGYHGSDCSNSICPNECNGHGTCSANGECDCSDGACLTWVCPFLCPFTSHHIYTGNSRSTL